MSADPMTWQPIETAPRDGYPIIFANWDAMCLLSGAPHVWTARFVEAAGEWFECSFAAENQNGEPTHWMPLPPPPSQGGQGT